MEKKTTGQLDLSLNTSTGTRHVSGEVRRDCS